MDEKIPMGENYYESRAEVQELEPEQDFEPPAWLERWLRKEYMWFAIAVGFAGLALYSAWEHKQLTLNYNELVEMYNNCAKPMGSW